MLVGQAGYLAVRSPFTHGMIARRGGNIPTLSLLFVLLALRIVTFYYISKKTKFVQLYGETLS